MYINDLGTLHPPQRSRLLQLPEDPLVLLADVRVLGALLGRVLPRLPVQANLTQAALQFR